MADKKWTISLLLLFTVFLYFLVMFALTARKMESFIQYHEKKIVVQKKKAKHFVLIAQELDNPYWRTIEQGAREAAGKYDMEMEYEGPFRNNAEEQIKLLDKAITARVDGIIVQGLNDKLFTPYINHAIELGIPVLTIDTDAASSRRFTYVGTDNYASGKLLGQTVVNDTRGQGNVGIIIGSSTAESQQLRLSGLRDALRGHPGMRLIDIRASNISRIQAAQQAEEMLIRNPDITVMVGTSALDAVGILQATKNIRKQGIQIFGYDGLDETMKAIANGEIRATAIQKPYEMGYDAVILLNDYYKGGSLPHDHYIPVQIRQAPRTTEDTYANHP